MLSCQVIERHDRLGNGQIDMQLERQTSYMCIDIELNIGFIWDRKCEIFVFFLLLSLFLSPFSFGPIGPLPSWKVYNTSLFTNMHLWEQPCYICLLICFILLLRIFLFLSIFLQMTFFLYFMFCYYEFETPLCIYPKLYFHSHLIVESSVPFPCYYEYCCHKYR